MESSKNSLYNMLMTVVFYTTGSICALRATVWLAARTLLPIISHIASHYYHYRSPAASPPSPADSSAAPHDPASLPSADSAGEASGAAVGLFFKLVRTAAGHDLFVPVPIGLPVAATGSDGSMLLLRGVITFILFSAFVGACGVAVYTFAAVRNSARNKIRKLSITPQSPRDVQLPEAQVRLAASAALDSPALIASPPSPWPAALKRASATTTTTVTTKLNPAAPVFKPSPPVQRLDPTARAFTSRSWGSGGEGKNSSAPPSPADSVGPVTPSPVRSAFAFAARLATRGRSSGDGEKQAIPVGVGKMRVVRPEEVVISERRAGEVFVFF